MSDVDRVLPTTGYSMTKLWASEIEYAFVDPDDISEQQGDRLTGYFWDWMAEEGRSFYVVLGAALEASRKYPERAKVTLIGEFKIESGETTIALRDFVMSNAPTMMFPYVRELIASLTGRGLFGPYYIPPFYLSHVLQTDYSFEESSGFETLMARPELAEEFGFPTGTATQALPKPQTDDKKKSRKPRAKKEA